VRQAKALLWATDGVSNPALADVAREADERLRRVIERV